VADHTKVGLIARAQVCPLSGINLLITDSGMPEDHAVEFALRGLEVHRV
jgi:DeoR/GlpR family transcriptional regulator of sugar metabolism